MKLSNINAVVAYLHVKGLVGVDEVTLSTKLDTNMIYINGVKTSFLSDKDCEELNKKYGIIVLANTTDGILLCIPNRAI